MSFSWIQADQPALVLAPMEGVTDAPMRALLSERGGFSFCVSEFLRISQEVLPPRTYFEHVPELSSGCKTPAGTPIQFQLLGGHEERLALSALRACELGAQAIDLNFGCPAPTVNRHDGGASLLRSPQRIRSIVSAVRRLVPPEIPVSAKLRLGWENMEDIFINAENALAGGASWLTIHARTKIQGYAPPAHWKYIGRVREQFKVPVIANGEIWSFEDFLKCEQETGCRHFMVGRGALSDPSLPHRIATHLGIASFERIPFFGDQTKDWEPIFKRFSELTSFISPKSHYTVRRIKQWLRFVQMRNPLSWYDQAKRTRNLDELFQMLC